LTAGVNSPTRYAFDWDPRKAASNHAKHGVSFDEAMSVFGDPLQLSRLDQDHGADEERWVTLGMNGKRKLLIVVHTYAEVGDNDAMIRILSARSPTRRETRQYEGARQ